MRQDLNARRAPLRCEVIEHVGTLSVNGAFSKELNFVSWENNPATYDIRNWREYDGMKMPMKGLTVTEDELRELYAVLKERFEGHE